MIRTQTIDFQDHQTLCIFPTERAKLAQAVSELGLKDTYPVIVLIGGGMEEQQAAVTQRAMQAISGVADEMGAIGICGGTDMKIMAEIGRIRSRNGYKFPWVGIAPEELVTWPGGPHSGKFLGWGEKRSQLEPHYSHFILVPGSQFGDESPWIADAATALSKDHTSVTILIGGGEVSRKDIELSLEMGRPVIALSRTGHLADELGRQPNRHKLISVIPVHAEQRITEAVQAALAMNARSEEAVTVKSLVK
jgi:uridylate kinase